MDVVCPVCSEKVSGRDVSDLEAVLQGHLERAHGMTRAEGRPSRPTFSGETEAERQVTTFSGRSPEELSGEEVPNVAAVTKFKEPGRMETPEERSVTTFSEREPNAPNEEVQEVTQLKEPREMEGQEECQTRTFSATECESVPEKTGILKEEVGQWKYPRTGEEGERGPLLHCPLCGMTVGGTDEENLSDQLKNHFLEVHEVERQRISMRE